MGFEYSFKKHVTLNVVYDESNRILCYIILIMLLYCKKNVLCYTSRYLPYLNEILMKPVRLRA